MKKHNDDLWNDDKLLIYNANESIIWKYIIKLMYVFDRLPDDVQKYLTKNCGIFFVDLSLGSFVQKVKKEHFIIINVLSHSIHGMSLKAFRHTIAHEFAHAYLNHETYDEKEEREADLQAEQWGFKNPDF